MDLTQAIQELTRAGESRRQSRKQLRNAVKAIETAIVEELRTGDTIVVDKSSEQETRFTVARVGYYGSQGGAGSGWPVKRCPKDKLLPCLIMNRDAILDPEPFDDEDGWFDGHNIQHHKFAPRYWNGGDGEMYLEEELRLASDQERLWFAEHVAEVIEAFTKLLESQGRSFAQAAKATTKIVVG